MSSVNNKTAKVLAAIDGIAGAPAPGFFYTRILARIERESRRQEKGFIFFRPAILVACLGLICFINTMVLLNRQQSPIQHQHNNKEAGIESFANEYNLTDDGNILQ